MSVLHLYQRPYTRFAKRTFDIVVASIGLSLTDPLLPVLALLVKLSKGPLIYSQTRLGEAGRHFTIYKFRTMRDDAEDPGRALWAEERDPRITPVGRFMRRTRLDELPQLVNVLRGEMSIVGPRPERPEFVELLEVEVPFWNRRHLVKPGITGWAQVSCGYASDAEGTVRKLSYDLWYLRHRSLAVDLGICAKTLRALVSGAGAR
jgi:lipopolysaccharide/colanic/teichoic acid biosynthesis glycosyltransferase